MTRRARRIVNTLRIAAATCVAIPILTALSALAEPEPIRDLAADLSRRVEPDALATAAMLYDSINEHADALERARQAAQLAPERADVAWLELQLCSQMAACKTDVPARRLATLDPLNGAVFLHELGESGELPQPRADRALLRVSQSERIDIYWNRLLVSASDVLARFPPAYQVESPDVTYSPVAHAAGMVAAVALPNFSRLSKACNREQTEDSTRRDLCLRIARSLQRGDTIMTEAIGLSFEERLWPAGSPEAAAARARRETLREWQEEHSRIQSDAGFTPRLIAALRSTRTEHEAGEAVLAQYRASGQTARPRAAAGDAAARNSSAGNAASDHGSAAALARNSGRMKMPIEFLNVNFLAVLVAALSSFLLGGLWYSRALFGVTWSREAGVSADKQGHKPMVFVTSYLLAFLAAWLFAALLPTEITAAQATLLGALIGMAWVATSFGINYGFGDRSLTLWLIDAGYHTLQFTLFGAIIGAWR